MNLFRLIRNDFENNPKFQITFNKFFTYFWLVNMVAVTVAFWFDRNDWDHYSIFYVAFISIYANFATNYGALAASQSSEAAHEAAEHATVLRNESPYVSSVEE